MARSGRIALAVLAGMVVWAVPWNLASLGAQAAFPELAAPGQPVTHVGLLVGWLALSVVLSLAAGYVTAWAAGRDPMRAVWILAIIQLAIGVVVEISFWSLMPVWYHLVFLALLVPATLQGGRLREGARRPRSQAVAA